MQEDGANGYRFCHAHGIDIMLCAEGEVCTIEFGDATCLTPEAIDQMRDENAEAEASTGDEVDDDSLVEPPTGTPSDQATWSSFSFDG